MGTKRVHSHHYVEFNALKFIVQVSKNLNGATWENLVLVEDIFTGNFSCFCSALGDTEDISPSSTHSTNLVSMQLFSCVTHFCTRNTVFIILYTAFKNELIFFIVALFNKCKVRTSVGISMEFHTNIYG